MSNEIPVREISEILDVVASKVPKLINDLLGTLFSAEAGAKIGQSAGLFYKELVNNGIPEDEALAMTKEYIASLTNLLRSIGDSMR